MIVHGRKRSPKAGGGGVEVFLVLEVGPPDAHLLVLALVLALQDLLLLLVLDVLDLVGQDLHLLQPEVDLLAQLVTQVFVDRRLLVVEDRLEGLEQLHRRVLRNQLRLPLRHHLLHVQLLLRLILLEDVGDRDPAERRFLFEDALADVLVELGLLLERALAVVGDCNGGR